MLHLVSVELFHASVVSCGTLGGSSLWMLAPCRLVGLRWSWLGPWCSAPRGVSSSSRLPYTCSPGGSRVLGERSSQASGGLASGTARPPWPLLTKASNQASSDSGVRQETHLLVGEAIHHITKGVYPRSYSVGSLRPQFLSPAAFRPDFR